MVLFIRLLLLLTFLFWLFEIIFHLWFSYWLLNWCSWMVFISWTFYLSFAHWLPDNDGRMILIYNICFVYFFLNKNIWRVFFFKVWSRNGILNTIKFFTIGIRRILINWAWSYPFSYRWLRIGFLHLGICITWVGIYVLILLCYKSFTFWRCLSNRSMICFVNRLILILIWIRIYLIQLKYFNFSDNFLRLRDSFNHRLLILLFSVVFNIGICQI